MLRFKFIFGLKMETKVDFIREWKSKALDSEQVFGQFARCISPKDFIPTYSFDQKCYQKRLWRDETGVVLISQFYHPNVEERYSTRDQSSFASSFGKIYLTSHTVVESCALDQS